MKVSERLADDEGEVEQDGQEEWEEEMKRKK